VSGTSIWSQYSFEPLGSIFVKVVYFKMALLLAAATHVSELYALLVHSMCTKVSPSGNKVFLKPNLAFKPKCFPAFTSEMLELSTFHPPHLSSAQDQRLNALWAVRALQTYGQEQCCSNFLGAPSHRESPI